MVHISAIKINTVKSTSLYISKIVESVEDLTFDFCEEPVEVTISDPNIGESQTWTPVFDILVENKEGYFGFSI